MSSYKIALLVRTLRKDPLNMKMARAHVSLTPDSMSAEMLNISDLPLYNEDLEASIPPEWKRFHW